MQPEIHDQMRSDMDSLVGLVREMPLRETIMSWATHHLRTARQKEVERLTSPGRQIAFLIAILVGTPEPDTPAKVDETRVQEVQRLLNRVFSAYSKMFFVGLEEESEAWNEAAKIAMPALLHFFNQGSLATAHQVRDLVADQFAPFDDVLAQEFGISASDALTVIQAIEDLLDESEASAREEHERASAARNQLLDENNGDLAELRQRAKDSGAKESVQRLMSAIDEMLVIRLAELNSRVGKIGDHFWQCFAVRREQFSPPRYINDLLETDARSLFHVADGEALALNLNLLYTAAVAAFERCLLKSSARERFLKRRDQLLEDRVENSVRGFFPADAIIARSVAEEKGGTHEHDLIVQWREFVFVFESKASPPKEPFRDPVKAATRIARHFRSDAGIQKGFEQAQRIATRLSSGAPVVLFDASGNPVLRLEPSDIADTFSICITADDFEVLATDLSVLLKKADDTPYPWVASVNDLESILQAWCYRGWQADKFVEFLKGRAQLHGRVKTFDELEVAGYMLKHETFDQLVKADGDRIILGPDYARVFDEIEAALAGGPAPCFEETNTPFIGDLRQMLREELGTSHEATRHASALTKSAHSSAKVGRNQPCPCSSGLKFKKCCGRL